MILSALCIPSKWDSADYLKTEEDRALYFEACLKENDPKLITRALGVIARARSMSQLAKDTGLSRESLYKALSNEENPSFATILNGDASTRFTIARNSPSSISGPPPLDKLESLKREYLNYPDTGGPSTGITGLTSVFK